MSSQGLDQNMSVTPVVSEGMIISVLGRGRAGGGG